MFCCGKILCRSQLEYFNYLIIHVDVTVLAGRQSSVDVGVVTIGVWVIGVIVRRDELPGRESLAVPSVVVEVSLVVWISGRGYGEHLPTPWLEWSSTRVLARRG